MPRSARRNVIAPGETYHVYARAVKGKSLFYGHDDYIYYLSLLGVFKQQHSILLYHLSLMPNHVHLELSPRGDNLSSFMQNLQGRFAKRFCSLYEHNGPVWRGRFKQRHIGNDAQLFACGNYIEMNPVRAGLVDKPEDWPYSSYRFYAEGYNDLLIDEDPFYKNLGLNNEERMRIYKDCVDKTRRI